MKNTSLFLVLAVLGCGDSNSLTSTGVGSTDPGDLPPGYEQFAASVTVYRDGDEVVIQSDDVPDHGSPYFGTSDSRYEAPDAGMVVNPNRIAEQNLIFRLPASPTLATASETQLGPIGVALNGVAFFNQYAGRTASGWLPLDNEIATFDRYNGHPAPGGVYHYHMEPFWLTAGKRASLIGFMADGFPIYGPDQTDGTVPADLDSCNGHTTSTAEYPDGVYHYHATESDPYLVGCYRGSAGSISNF